MCGIVGIAGNQTYDLIEIMNASMFHRGPDDGGIYRDVNLSLGMRRLSIIDLDGGHQPMITPDGRYVLVFNGEVYNSKELRQELQKSGVCFQTDHSDTEVLLHLLAREGESCLNKLNGMFAFAFFDRFKKTLLCVRDRLGIKPFFYTQQGGRFAFASELKSILVLPWIRREPDLDSLFNYFSVQYVPGESTAFTNIKRLPPGTSLFFEMDSSKVSIKQWWAPSFPGNKSGSPRTLAYELGESITSAVDRWSVSDVPVGCLLSGGLDSSAIVSLLSRKGHNLKTYTVGFSGAGEASWDELGLAKKVANKWGTEHHELILDPERLLDDLIDMVYALDEPYGGGLPSWAVFKAMGSEVKVAMTGTGGDELFGNYNKFVHMEGRFRGLIPFLRRKRVDRKRFRDDFFDKYYYAGDIEKRELMLTDRFNESPDTLDMFWGFFNGSGKVNLRDRVVRTDLATQLPEEFLMMTDRFSMAHSIEARTPLLDHKLVEKVYAINAMDRLNARKYKPLLRQVVSDFLPMELMRAPKRGFVIPLKLWLQNRLAPLLKRVLKPDRLIEQGLIQKDFYERYAIPHIQGRRDYTNKLWTMLMFQLWWDVYILERPRDELSYEVKSFE